MTTHKIMSDRQFEQLMGTFLAASKGEPWAEDFVGRMTDTEFNKFMDERRRRRLVDPATMKAEFAAKQGRLPSFPPGTGSAGTAGNGILDPDPPRARGMQRIIDAMNAG